MTRTSFDGLRRPTETYANAALLTRIVYGEDPVENVRGQVLRVYDSAGVECQRSRPTREVARRGGGFTRGAGALTAILCSSPSLHPLNTHDCELSGTWCGTNPHGAAAQADLHPYANQS